MLPDTGASLIYLVRHGETQATLKRRYEGRGDSDLTGTGITQARQAASMLAPAGIQTVYSSPRRRALRRSQIIADRLGLRVQVLDGLAEADFGEWEGLTYEEIWQRYAAVVERWYEDPLSNRPPGGESLSEMWERVRLAMAAIISEGLKSVAVISHGGPIRSIASFCEHGDLRAFWSVQIRPGEVKPVRLEKGYFGNAGNTSWDPKNPEGMVDSRDG